MNEIAELIIVSHWYKYKGGSYIRSWSRVGEEVTETWKDINGKPLTEEFIKEINSKIPKKKNGK